MKTHEFRISQVMFDELSAHLFPGDHDEHGAVIAAGICRSKRGTRFLARKLFLAREGIDYVPSKYGYRALSAEFVARVSGYCSQHKLAYFAIHCHGGRDEVAFSSVDLESHKRSYPALLDITEGVPVGALVFATNAVAGEIWTPDGIERLTSMVIVGMNHRRLYPQLPRVPEVLSEIYHRQSLLFGARGQAILKGTKVGVIGMGGVGSLVSEWLARLGVGEIVAIDYDKLEPSNQSRVMGARWWDAPEFLLNSRLPLLRKLGTKLSTYKVSIGERVARAANPRVKYQAIIGSIVTEEVALQLKDADYIFLCADSMQSRLVFNALVHQFLVPGVQIGSKVSVDRDTGDITDIFCVTRPVLPQAGGGCLWCNQLISSSKLQEEVMSVRSIEASAVCHGPRGERTKRRDAQCRWLCPGRK
ncbi:ThiF family adenylyltransferase [Geminisphaera colitermitum]|uniref:ThiF family adenylyltransferase n=1 Tax=Geminisphaera colitermitum TaxID=1148786 RepID=UPI00069424FA|nr:ThiF family adenylyltransferase [Geminisphaera colitermitum]